MMDEKIMEKHFEDASIMLRQDEPNMAAFQKLMREIENELDKIMYDAGITSQQTNARIRPQVIEIMLGIWGGIVQLRMQGHYSAYFDGCLALWDKLKRFASAQQEDKAR